jgi:hypothetical protein
MSGQSAVSAPVRVRRFALLAGIFALILGPSCGRENFDLLNPGLGDTAGAGQSNSAGTSGHSGSGGGERDAGPTPAGGTSGTGGSNPVDGGPSCSPTAASCKHCQNQADCGGHGSSTPICDALNHLCVACLDATDCGAGQICDSSFFRCEKSCQNVNDCDASHFCSRNVCVECRVNSDCPSMHGHPNMSCFAEFCVECSDDTECPQDKPSCQAFHCVAQL